jgi:Response regulator receiver domain
MSSTGNAAVQVLVVEDEALIRMETREVIEEAKFEVYEACNADEAIELLAAHSDIALIFTDVDMPGSMDGVKLAHYVALCSRAAETENRVLIQSLSQLIKRCCMPFLTRRLTKAGARFLSGFTIGRRLPACPRRAATIEAKIRRAAVQFGTLLALLCHRCPIELGVQ